MSIKKKAAMSMASVAMGAMAVMGGTFAYFSDTTASANSFTNGTINIAPNSTYLEKFNIVNFKPGDKLSAVVDNQEPAMMLNNQGSLPFDIFLKMEAPSTTYDAMKDVIVFEKLYLGNETDGDLLAEYFPGESEVTLREVLAVFGTGNAVVNGNTISNVGKYIGYLDANDNDGTTTEQTIKGLKYVIKFKDTGVEQNDLQGKSTGINFSFTALQYNGENIDQGAVDNGSTGGGGEFKRNDNINDRDNSGN
ncbi:TasA family protein [Mesobacillus jeotgali]|uniref:TasA family protein n=1 Tax=Mesobacillus jeotgali TaxID=129985 RepID=A0ABY9VIG2_9BACI|nr:TasA family protein [Mesobacillus jeotgali]WNF23645.1 TasA family protein [Mesobacillus jeotgali]